MGNTAISLILKEAEQIHYLILTFVNLWSTASTAVLCESVFITSRGKTKIPDSWILPVTIKKDKLLPMITLHHNHYNHLNAIIHNYLDQLQKVSMKICYTVTLRYCRSECPKEQKDNVDIYRDIVSLLFPVR